MTIKLSEVIGKGYNRFWNDTKRYRVLKGGKGSKKSATTALNFIFRIMQYKNSNLLVVRAVMNTHRDSTFAQLKWAQNKLGVGHLWQNNVSPMEMTYLPTGQKILFRGFDDVLKLASTTVEKGSLCWVWVEEAFEIASEYDFDKLDLSVPRGKVDDNLFKQTTLTFNPWSENHWLKRRFFDKENENVSTYSTTYLCNEFLDDTDMVVFERMKEEQPRKYDVAGLGNWGIAEGLIYENWEVGIPEISKEDEYKWNSFFGLDYGYTNDPTAFIAFKANPIDKIIYVYDEFYKTKMLNCDIAEMIIQKGYAKERIRADAAEPKSNDDLRRLGIVRIAPSVKGKDSIINGISKIQEYKIYINPLCKNALAEFSSYCWKQDKNESGLNIPEDRNNHLMDALRYAFKDVQSFHPITDTEKKQQRKEIYHSSGDGVRPADFIGGWF